MSNDIEQIKQRLDIVELVQEYVPLKKVGSNWKANCPFHNEKSPSFMVSQEKQIWHCFGCDRGGDMFGFLKEIEGVEFAEALRMLATRAGVQLQQYDPAAHNHRTTLLDCVVKAQRFYQKQLQDQPEAGSARSYLKERGISEITQQQFGLGYSPSAWDKTYQYLLAQGFSAEDIFSSGLTIKKDTGTGYYDRFRGRLMIPLLDISGQVVGFTARTLQADEPGGKYVNSPQSDVYDKSAMVYGLHFAKQAIKKLDASILVEGNIDVLSAHQSGFPNVVAVSGTALTDRQIELLKRYSENMLLAFDMDAAGIKAAQRGIDIALRHNMNIKVIQLPSQFKDPDDCIQHDPQQFKQAIRGAVHIIDFFFKTVTQPLDLSRVEHKKKAVKQLLPVLQKITDTVEQAHYIQRLADLVTVDATIIETKLRQNRSQRSTAVIAGKQPVPAIQDRFSSLSRELLAVIFGIPEQFKYCIDYLDPEYLTDEAIRDLYKRMLDYYNNEGIFNEPGYLEKYVADRSLVDMLHLLRSNTFPEADRVQLQEHMIVSIRELRKSYVSQRLRHLEGSLKQAEQAGDADATTQLLKEFQMLTHQLTELS